MADEDAPLGEDEREIELSTIIAIYPELLIDSEDPFSATLDLQVTPATPLVIQFPAAADGAAPTLGNANAPADAAHPHDDLHRLSYLPPLQVEINLPDGYPTEKAPIFRLTTSPPWLSKDILENLEADGVRLWEEFGHDQTVFAYIDHLQQAAENAFGVQENDAALAVPQECKIALLDFEMKAKRAAFEKETFDCGICLDPKKGSDCHRMTDCGHVFCISCLQDFYNNAITEGDITTVKCLSPGCAKARSEIVSNTRSKKTRTFITPGELLEIPIEASLVKRYVDLKHKAEVESDKNTVYCPRKWCQGAARSKKYKKPQGLELAENTDSESDEESKTEKKGVAARTDLMRVCEDCSYAFCSRCFQGWHGEYTLCIPRQVNGELTEEDKASLEYLKLYSTPCPTCAAPAQKTHGCNHMICYVCSDHFCYLCQAYLEPGNPYQHYNVSTGSCYMRLWELEGGDGDDVGIGYAGGLRDPEEANLYELVEDMRDIPEPGFVIVEDPRPAQAQAQAQAHNQEDQEDQAPPEPPQPALVRENPLVLRINELPARPQPPQEAPAPQQPREVFPRQGPRYRAPDQNPRGPFHQRQPGRRHAAAVARLAAARQAEADQRRNRQQNRQAPRQQIQAPRQNQNVPVVVAPAENEAARDGGAAAIDEEGQAWVQHFVHMALNDQEDLIDWDSDDEEDLGRWDIPVR